VGSPRRIETVIFDLDDTLIDWSNQAATWGEFFKPRTESVRRYLIQNGYEMPPAPEFYGSVEGAIRQLWSKAKETCLIQPIGDMLLELLLEIGHDVHSLDMRALLESYNWQPFPGVVPFDDTLPVLKQLKAEDYKIGLLTNSFLPMWMRDVELRSYKIIDFFDARLTAADVGYIKPHPKIFEQLLDMLDSEAQRSLFVGDRPAHDIAGANEVGLISVLITPPHVEFDLNGVVPDFTIKTLSELPVILTNIATS
jgi:HAD superfamily hydrolase (TIGR01509 family)